MKNYVMYHTHSMYSNGTTNVDSVTRPLDYIKKAVELGMSAIAFSEHGNVFEWTKKKELCEEYGLKYIHGVEAYVTENLSEKTRDNYHCGLYARNFDGVMEINELISKANDRKDGHYFYTPRITFSELLKTSNNVIITTACIGGILYKGSEKIRNTFINFMEQNKERCFLEVQPHADSLQGDYNRYLEQLSNETGIRLIAGTDTHALNKRHEKGRKIMQLAKGINFGDEDSWTITMMNVDQLVNAFWDQCALTEQAIYNAIDNTNVLADMIEEFKLDRSFKYPKLFEAPEELIRDRVARGLVERNIINSVRYQEYMDRIEYELDTYIYQGAVDYLLLDMKIKDYGRENDIYTGCSRGSVAGSVVAYLIGLIDIDPIKENLNFERFMNKERVSLADIDSDYPPSQREFIKDFIFDIKNVYCADIITFNTVALKGSIRDVCRALYTGVVPEWLEEKAESDRAGYGKLTDSTRKMYDEYSNGKYLEISNYICSNVEESEDNMRKEYPEVFEYVDIISGTIVSIGSHPCGSVVSPVPLEGLVGLCSLKDSERPVTMLSMKQVDSLNFVKLDILGLDNQEIINETCKMAGIDRLTPDNVPIEEEVWKSIRNNTVGVFQWESPSATDYIAQLFSDETIARIKEVIPDFKYIDIFSVGNGAIRPAGASYRDLLAEGIIRDNGHEALNKFLAPTLGYLVYQEQIIEFLHVFCGYTMGQADTVRRGFAKKTGTEKFIPKIIEGFQSYMKSEYQMDNSESRELVRNFIQVIEDASSYLFSLNHAQAYSYIGYMCAYLREYHPLEFYTVSLNQFESKREKTIKIMENLKEKDINVEPPTFGKSRSKYFCDANTNTIYKGLSSVKFINEEIAESLYELSKVVDANFSFIDLLQEFKINNRQLETLIKIGYFRNLGTTKKLLKTLKLWNETFKKKTYRKSDYTENQLRLIGMFAGKETEKQYSQIDKAGLVDYVTRSIEDEFTAGVLVGYQLELMGSSNIVDKNADPKTCVVESVNAKYTPTLTLYKVATGETIEVKVGKKFFNEKPLVEFTSIYVASCETKDRRKKDHATGDWIKTGEKFYTITYYII